MSSTVDRRRRTRVAMVYGTSLFQGLTFITFPAISEVLKRDLGLAETVYGSLYLPMVGVAAVVAFVAAPARSGRSLQELYLLGLLADLTSLFLLALCGTLPLFRESGAVLLVTLVLAAIVLGSALGIMGIVLNAAAIDLFPKATARALSILHASLGVGASLAPLHLSAHDQAGRWPFAPGALALLGLCLWITGWRVRPMRADPGVGPPASPEPESAALHRTRRTRLFLRGGTTALYGLAEATFATWAVLYLTQAKGLSSPVAAAALSGFWIAITGGRLLVVPFLSLRSGRIFATGFLLATVAAFLLLPAIQSATQAFAVYAFAGLACSGVFPILLGTAADELPGNAARVSSWLSAFLLAGIGVGAFWVGPIAAWFGMSNTFRIAVVWPLLLLGLYWALETRPVPSRAVVSGDRAARSSV